MCLSNIADRARATLTAATTTVSVGDRVTLICSVEKSAGWKYEWFRRTSHTSEDTINDGLNGNIRVSQGGIYRCRGFRGEPAVYSDPSDEVTIQITFSNKVSVTQKPSWSQIFRGERITLTCEVQGGEGVQWEYEWRTPQSQTFRTKQKDWTITASISGDYSCKSRPTDDSYSATNWSEALRLSFLDPPKAQISRSGGTLTCSVNPSSSGWSYYFYREKNQEVLTVQNTDFHSNREIRVSQGGVYKCRGGRGEPVYHTEFSDPVTIVAHKPKAELKITKSPVGGRVTLSCSVKPSSSGWSFFWFRGEKPSKLLRTQDADFLSNGQIRVSQGGVYRCRGGRGEPVYHTEFSDPVTIGEFNPCVI
uniref:Ig-like domain-containing protein n=1 Tax=Oryzias latipes TaxID=8090 RepID=A0A3B3I9R9_ORYLA